jgi:hypothetical protein
MKIGGERMKDLRWGIGQWALGVLYALGVYTLALPQLGVASGGTSSGGGNGYSNRGNPWFLENTARVDYCIDLDEQAMGVSAARAAELVRSALQYWKNSFALSFRNGYAPGELVPFGQVRIATQDFRQSPCSDSTQLRFQLGRLATPQQEQLIGPNHDLIGIAMRTAYDTVNLRGSGFVFITPQTGPLKTRAAGFSEEAWSTCDGCVLELALKHELGHVFGVEHVGDGDMNWNFMANHFLAEFTSQDVVNLAKNAKAAQYVRTRFGLPFFTFDEVRPIVDQVGNESESRELLGQLEEDEWLQIRRIPSQTLPGFHDLVIESFVPDSDSPPLERARSCDTKSRRTSGFSRRGFGLLFLPSEQKVFHKWPIELKNPVGMIRKSHAVDDELEMSDVLCSKRPDAQIERFGIHLVATRSGSSLSVAVGENIFANFLQEAPGGRFSYMFPPTKKPTEPVPGSPKPILIPSPSPVPNPPSPVR